MIESVISEKPGPAPRPVPVTTRPRPSNELPMVKQVAEGVLIHRSESLQNNTVVVHGGDGVPLVDAGFTGPETTCLANDLRELGRPVVAGFSTHPDWDHVLWHAELGDAPRYGTARCAADTREDRTGPRVRGGPA